jgi:CubicO group peptidase (beta-lactamase class C family)
MSAAATGYHSVDRQLEAARPSDLALLGAAGALCGNIDDVLRWQAALVHGQVIRPELWNRMITPETLSDGRMLDYGFAVSIQSSDYGPTIMHEGATAGFNSFFIHYPDHDLTLVLLANTDRFESHLRGFSFLIAAKLLPAP